MKKLKIIGFFEYTIRIFLFFCFFVFCFGLLFGVFQSIKTNSLYGFRDSIFGGIIGALITLPILVFIDILQKIKCFFKYKAIDFRVIQKRRFVIDKNYPFVINGICNILNNIKQIDTYNKNEKNGVIEAVTKHTWKSLGEKIKFELFRSSADKVVIVLISKPKLFTTMIDYCKNFENVEIITKYMMKDFKEYISQLFSDNRQRL